MAIVSSLFSLGSAKVTQAAMNGTSSNKTSLQAQQYAVSEAALLQAVPYSDLKASAKAEIPNSSYFTETSLSSESNYTDATKKRTATIHIYFENETVPRASLAVDRYSVEPEKISVIPIGIDAGLPNIIGTLNVSWRNNGTANGATGAFIDEPYYGADWSSGSGSVHMHKYTLNASRCSPIYGRSSTVQPPAVTVRYFIKAA